MELSRVWSKVLEVLVLLAPFILRFFDINITAGIEGLDMLVVQLGALIVVAKDVWQIILGYFKSGSESFLTYVGLSYHQYEKAVQAFNATSVKL